MKSSNLLKTLLLSLVFANSLVYACPQDKASHCNANNKASKQNTCHKQKREPFLGTVSYALRHIELTQVAWNNIHRAAKNYKSTLRNKKDIIPHDALINGKLNIDSFVSTSYSAKVVQAQKDLLQTIVNQLTTKQNKQFAMLVSAHQYTMSLRGYFQATQNKPQCNCSKH